MINDFNSILNDFEDWKVDIEYQKLTTTKNEIGKNTSTLTEKVKARGVYLPDTQDREENTPQEMLGLPVFKLYLDKSIELNKNDVVFVNGVKHFITAIMPFKVATNFNIYRLVYAEHSL